MRNGNSVLLLFLHLHLKVLTVPMRNGNLSENENYKACEIPVLTVPMRNGNSEEAGK